VIDPTQNVLDLVQAAIQRQDDLREAERRHNRELAELRWKYDGELRKAETARIDAIRAVDVGAVQRAAEVQLAQATALATKQATMAETLRAQVGAAATAWATSMDSRLVPLQEAIADLRRAQYEAQGVKSNVGDTRLNIGALLGGLAVAISLVLLIVTLLRR